MLSRRTWARIQLLFLALILAYQLWGYRAGKRYAAAVAAGEKPPADELRDRHQEAIEAVDDVEEINLSKLLRELQRAEAAEMYGSKHMRTHWVFVGMVRGVFNGVRHDLDVLGTRRSVFRRILFVLAKVPVERRLFDDNARYSMSTGVMLGFVAYRIKYGLASEPLGD